MRNHALTLTLMGLLVGLGLGGWTLPAQAQFEITNPPEYGAVVTEVLPIQATLGDEVQDGYVIFYIENKEMKEGSPIEDHQSECQCMVSHGYSPSCMAKCGRNFS